MGEALKLFPGQEAAHEIVVAGKPAPWHILPTVRGTLAEIIALCRRNQRPKVNISLGNDSKSYQVRIARAAHKVIDRQLRGCLRVELVFVHARPAYMKREGRQWHGVAPDVDKVMRNVLDGLQRGPAGKPRGRSRPKGPNGKPLPWPGVIADDCLVVKWAGEDWYAAEDEDPHTVIRLWEL